MTDMRRFILRRLEDVNGVSGTGVVVEGVRFSDGACAIRWCSDYPSTTHHDSIDNVVAVHGHNGKTVIEWLDPWIDPADETVAARARVAELEAVIREYVAEVENGARFDALVSAVPGLESDDGMYPTAGADR